MADQDAGLPQTHLATENTVPLYDIENNHVVHVGHDDVQGLVSSGKYAAPKDGSFPVTDADGNSGMVSGEDLSGALSRGFNIDSLATVKHNANVEQYGNSPVLAGLASAARTATISGSDLALTSTGLVKPETLEGLKDANPGADLGGVGVGIVAPALLTGGGSLLEAAGAEGLGAAATTAGKVAGLGFSGVGAAGEGAAKLVAKLGAKAGIAEGALKVLAPLAGSAVEGAFYTTGNLISEDALGEAPFNAESLASSLGTGALIGGAFGAVGQAVGAAAAKTSPFMTKMFEAASNELDEFGSQEKQAAKALGVMPRMASKQIVKDPNYLQDGLSFLKDDLGMTTADTPHSLETKMYSAENRATSAMDSVEEQAFKGLSSAPELAPTKAEIWNKAIADVKANVLDEMSQAKGTTFARDTEAANKLIANMENLASEPGTMGFRDLQNIKRAEQAEVNYNTHATNPLGLPIEDRIRGEIASSLRNSVQDLTQKLETAGAVAPGTTQQLADANGLYGRVQKWKLGLIKNAIKPNTGSLSGVGAVLGLAAGPVGAVAGAVSPMIAEAVGGLTKKLIVLGKMEGALQSTKKLLAGAADAMVTVGKGASKGIVPLGTNLLMKTPLAKDYSGQEPKNPRDRVSAYQNINKNLNAYATNPTGPINTLTNQTQLVSEAAPKTAGELTRVGHQAALFLQSKLPKQGLDAGVMASYLPPRQPSGMEMSKFERYLDAVNSPAVTLKNIMAGTVTNEHMEALREVYPNMFQQLRDTVMQQLPEKAGKMSYKQRLTLGMMLGMPTDASLKPESVTALQQQFNSPTAGDDDPNTVNTTQGGIAKISKAERSSTGLNDLAEEGAGHST